MSAFFFEWLGKQRVEPIIQPGKLELESDVMGGGFPAMSQAKSSAGTRIIVTPLLAWTLWQGFVAMTWWSRRFPQIVLENFPTSHVSYRQYQCTPLVIISSMVFLKLSSPISPCTFYFIAWHAWGQVSPYLACTLECDSLRRSAAGVSPPWYSSSMLGKSLLKCDGVSHGAGWEWRFPFNGGGRRGRRRSPKGVTGTVAQVSAAGILLSIGGVLVAADSMPRQCHWGWRQLMGSYLGVLK